MCTMLGIALLLVLGVLALAYLYLSYLYSYWSRKGLAQPPTTLGFGNILDAVLGKRAIGEIYTNIYRQYPDHSAVGVYGSAVPRLLVRSPQLIQRVLVSDFSSFHDNEFFVSKKVDPYFYEDPFALKGDEWKPSRTKTISTVTTARVKEVYHLMKEIIPRLNAYIDSKIGEDLKAKDLAQLFMMDNVSNVVFGIESNCFSDPEAPFRKVADIQMKVFLQSLWRTVLITCFPKAQSFLGMKVVPDEVADYIRSLVKQVYQYRKQNNIKRNDLFQYFMSKENGDDIEELMYYGILFFIEGIETSAMVASSAIYELALNPCVQESLCQEVSSVQDLDWDTLYSLSYLDKVIKEAMRKYPIAYSNIRECTKPITLDIDGKQVGIELGTPVIVPVFAVHRDPQYYPDPDKFEPERFSEESMAARPPYTYFPFGEGPRTCPGMRFGLTQVKLLLYNLVRKYRILSTEKTPRALTFQAGSFLIVPKEEVWMKLEKRN